MVILVSVGEHVTPCGICGVVIASGLQYFQLPVVRHTTFAETELNSPLHVPLPPSLPPTLPPRKQSLQTVLWSIAVRCVVGPFKPLLYSYQNSLPRLPVPRLADTCQRVSGDRGGCGLLSQLTFDRDGCNPYSLYSCGDYCHMT